MPIADLLQLPPVRGKLKFSQILGLQLWHLAKYADLTEAVWKNHKLFIDLLNKPQVGNIDGHVEKLRKARFIHGFDKSYPKNAKHMYAEKEPNVKRNAAVLNNFTQ